MSVRNREVTGHIMLEIGNYFHIAIKLKCKNNNLICSHLAHVVLFCSSLDTYMYYIRLCNGIRYTDICPPVQKWIGGH